MIQSAIVGSRLGNLIRARREARDIKSFELAAYIGRQPSLISRLETGAYKETPPPEILAALSTVLGLSQAEMLEACGYDLRGSPPTVPVTDPERADLLQKLERVALDDESRVAALTAILDLWLRQDRDAERPVKDFVVDPRDRRAGPFDHDLAPHNP